MVGVVLDRAGSLLATPQFSAFGAVDLNREAGLAESVRADIEEAIEGLDDDDVIDDEQVRDTVRVAVRRSFSLIRHRRPIIEVQITRLDPRALEGEAFESREVAS